MKNGKAIIFCAPSGSGKTTLVKHLLSVNSNLGFSISACTRDKRGRNEVQGKDYYFLSIEEFKEKIQPYKKIIGDVAKDKNIGELEAMMKICDDDVIKNNGWTLILLMAATIELVEPSAVCSNKK